MRTWNGLSLRIEQPDGWARIDDPNATVFESPRGVELRISPLELPPSLLGSVSEKSLTKWGIWVAQQMGLLNPAEQRTGTCPFGPFATLTFKDLNGGELPRAQLWFVSDGKHAFFVTLVGAPTPDEHARVRRVIDGLGFEAIEKVR